MHVHLVFLKKVSQKWEMRQVMILQYPRITQITANTKLTSVTQYKITYL
jgi:hypothetical protein